jgi:hypothetical protein
LGINIQLNQSALLLEIPRYFDERYNVNLEAYRAHTLQFTLCELWSRDIQCNNISAYSGFNIQVKVSAVILDIYRQFNVRYMAHMVPNTAHILQFTLSELWSRTYIECNYSYVYSGFNIQVNQSALLLEISRYFDARYNVNLVAYIAHTLQFTLSEQWSRTYTM